MPQSLTGITHSTSYRKFYIIFLNPKMYISSNMSQNLSDASENIQKTSGQWAEIIGELFDRLTGKGASVTYTFDNLAIDVPKAKGPNGQDMGSANWTINGKVVITAEAHEASEVQQKASISTAA